MARVPGNNIVADGGGSDVASYHRCTHCTKVFKNKSFLDNHMVRRHPEAMSQRYPNPQQWGSKPVQEPYGPPPWWPNHSHFFAAHVPPNAISTTREAPIEFQEPPTPPPWWPAGVPPLQSNQPQTTETFNATVRGLVTKMKETEESLRRDMEDRLERELSHRQKALGRDYEQERLKHEQEIQELKATIHQQLGDERAAFEEEKANLKELIRKAEDSKTRSRLGALEDDDESPAKIDSKELDAKKEASIMASISAKFEEQALKIKETMFADTDRDRKDLESKLKKANDQIMALREALSQEHKLNEARDKEIKDILSGRSTSPISLPVAKKISPVVSLSTIPMKEDPSVASVGSAAVGLVKQLLVDGNPKENMFEEAGKFAMQFAINGGQETSTSGGIVSALMSNVVSSHLAMGSSTGGAINALMSNVVPMLVQSKKTVESSDDEKPLSALVSARTTVVKAKSIDNDSSDEKPLSELTNKLQLLPEEGSFGDSSDDAPLSVLKTKSPQKELPVPKKRDADEKTLAKEATAERQPSLRSDANELPKPKTIAFAPIVQLFKKDDGLDWPSALEIIKSEASSPLKKSPWISARFDHSEDAINIEKARISKLLDTEMIKCGLNESAIIGQWANPSIQSNLQRVAEKCV
ncbi:hypothetical protein BC830DRAFT_824098 [Chytriomyces sp. MP71]|nr:hypothetical protein BC830DRAFT_824098 [Chytriomyces sp. MP71]